MAKTDTPTKYMVYRMMKKEFDVELNNEQLNVIEDVYLSEKRSSIFNVAVYRFVNALWSVIFMFIFWLFLGTRYDEGIFIVLMGIFSLYNIIHLWNNIIDLGIVKIAKEKAIE